VREYGPLIGFVLLFMLGPTLWKWLREFLEWRRPETQKLASWIGSCPACGDLVSGHQLRDLAVASATPGDLFDTLERQDWLEARRYWQWLGETSVAVFLLWCPVRDTATLLGWRIAFTDSASHVRAGGTISRTTLQASRT
jgi:hypothetical protein